MSIPPHVISFVLAEFVKRKMVPGEFSVDAPNTTDVALLLESFLEWARINGKLSEDSRLDLSGWC